MVGEGSVQRTEKVSMVRHLNEWCRVFGVLGGRQVDVVEVFGAKNQKQCEFNMSTILTTPRTSILYEGVKCGVG